MSKNIDLIYRLTSKSVDKNCIIEDPLDFEFFDTIARLQDLSFNLYQLYSRDSIDEDYVSKS